MSRGTGFLLDPTAGVRDNVTGFAHNVSNLNQIQVFSTTDGGTTWSRTLISNVGSVNYAARVADVTNGTGGVPLLNIGTVAGNGGGNVLLGQGGLDLYFGDPGLDKNDWDPKTETFIQVS